MVIKSQSTKKLRVELFGIGKEIDKRIDRLDKLPQEGKPGYLLLKNTLGEKQAMAEAVFRKSLMSTGNQVWDFAWDNVWDAIKELKSKATPDTKQNYLKLEPALQARQSSLKGHLKLSEMSGDQVWTEVWTAIWLVVGGVNDEYKHSVTAEAIQIRDELKALLDKQLVLQTELEELLR